IIHDCAQDIKYLRRDFNLLFTNVFDTKAGAKMLYSKSKYSFLLDKYFSIDTSELKDNYQCHDWLSRPYDRQTLLYAQLDCHFLIKIRAKLMYEI
ncbi:unnamed protein product, partial [Didymodactylos carnosus]